ncbi:hypothetical protein DH09_08215 [Bacillaceae bacterium JMAK1]|nr:hypothetical protein DH09_08215 [Bacillaceae bacterium JMAK1]
MSDKKEANEKNGNGKKQQNTSNVEVAFPKAEILSSAASFDVTPEVLAGAVYVIEKTELTKSEVEKAIKDFRSKEVK